MDGECCGSNDDYKIISPKWDKYFYNMCNVVKSQTNCLSCGVGAVIVSDGKYVVSTGYNGPPSNSPKLNDNVWKSHIIKVLPNDVKKKISRHDFFAKPKCVRKILGFSSGEVMNYCPCACAERNAIAQAARLGSKTFGTSLYLSDKTPCLPCAQSIIAAGIKEVIVPKLDNESHFEKNGINGLMMLKIADVQIREYKFESNGLDYDC